MLAIEQREKKGVCDISEIRDGKFIFFYVGAHKVEADIAVDRFMSRYFREMEARRIKR